MGDGDCLKDLRADLPFVQEYLIADSTRSKHPRYHVDEQVTHTQLALLCMSYVGIYLERSQRFGGHEVSPPKSTSRPRDATSLEHVSPLPSSDSLFLDEYVLPWGFSHLSHVDPTNEAVLRAIETLHSNAQRHPLQWNQLCRRSNYALPTLKHDFVLFILIAFAPAQLLRLFIGHTQVKSKDGTNPLVYAACFGTVEHARILLSSGVSLNCGGRDPDLDHHQVLPLEVAVKRAKFHMVNLFLDEGSPVPHELFVLALKHHGCQLPARIVSRLLQTKEFEEWATDGQDEGLLLRALDPLQYSPYRPSQHDMDTIHSRLLQIGCNPSTRLNETSLRRAVFAGHVSDVRHMLSLGIQLPADILLNASNAEMIRLCLSTGCDIHAVSSNEDTALHVSIAWMALHPEPSEEDRFESVRVLVDAGCNPSTFNLAGETPLHVAVTRGYSSIAEYLLALHVPLPPDILLCSPESRKASTTRLLTTKGADVHATAANGDTPLHRVLYRRDACADSQEQLDCIKMLIDAGCNPRLLNAYGKTAFDSVAENGYISVVRYLYDTLHSTFSSDILLSVAGSESWDVNPVLKFLIDTGASVHVTHPNGDTLLHLAIMALQEDTDSFDRVKLLVNAGCDPRARNLAGKTPFHVAAKRGHVLVMEYLRSLGIPLPSDVMVTQFEGDPDYDEQRRNSVCFLLDNGGDVHSIAQNGDTLLHLAAKLCSEEEALELAKYLVNAGCMPSTLNSEQETPLHIAAKHGYTSVIQYFLSLNTALPPDILLAASTGYSRRAPSIRCLVDQGASVSATTTKGDTSLHLLMTKGDEHDRLQCVKILVYAGCDPSARNSAGETPSHAAARNGFSKILEYFLSQGVPLPPDILLASETVATLRFCLGKGRDLRSVAASDVTELMHRVLGSHPEHDSVEFAKMLISTSDGWDPAMKNAAGETAIHVAARHLNMQAITFFLSQNVPLPSDVLLALASNFEDSKNYIVIRVARFLIREGARVNVAASNGDTPLHLALQRSFAADNTSFERQSWCLVEVLLNGGSDPSARNADGETPCSVAEAKGHFFNQNFLRLVRNSRLSS